MLKGEDVTVLLKLTTAQPPWTLRSLESDIAIPRSVIQRSLVRLAESRLYVPQLRRANLARAEEFLTHAVQYCFPAVLGGETRGIPTAWAARPLSDELAPYDDLPPVWPDALGEHRGLTLQPLHRSATEIARRDPALAELLALVDGLRAGDARVRNLAGDLLRARLSASATIPA